MADHHLSSLLENCKNLTVLHLRDMTNFVSDEVIELHQGSMYDLPIELLIPTFFRS